MLTSSKTTIQTLLLLGAQLFGLAVGFVSSMLVAKVMGAEKYGILSFATAVIAFLSIFFEFGYFASVSRLLAVNQDKEKEKQLIGAAVVILGMISALFICFVFAISFFIDSVFEDKVGGLLRIVSIVSWGFVIPFFMELVLKGSNSIEYLSGFYFFWKLFYILALVGLYNINQINPVNVLITMPATCAISFSLIMIKLNLSFDNLFQNIKSIIYENEAYGLKIYLSRIIGTGSFQLDRLMIGYFSGSQNVGFYSLANSLSVPIINFSFAFISSKYKELSCSSRIGYKVLLVNIAMTILAFLGAIILGYIVIYFYLGREYEDTFLLLILMSIAVLFQSLYQPYNAWMGGHGLGKELLILSLYYTVVNLVGNLIFVYLWGAVGAALVSILANGYYYFHSLIIYMGEIKFNLSNPSESKDF